MSVQLDAKWLQLAKDLMNSDVSKEEFIKFIQSKKAEKQK